MTFHAVLRELGAIEHLQAVDPAWARTMPLAPEADLWRVLDARAAETEGVDPEEELAELLSWATSQRVMDEHDRELLVGLAEAACQLEVTRSRKGAAGCAPGPDRAS